MSTPHDPYATPPEGDPPSGRPAYGQPQHGQPQHGQPQYGVAPQYGAAPAYGQGQTPQPGYGGAPGYGPAPTAPTTRPSTVANAVRLMYVGAALSLLAGILTITMRDEMLAEFERQSATQGTDVPAGFVENIFGAVVVISIVFGVIGAALWIMNAVCCGRGRNWSRITGTVLGGIWLLVFLIGLAQPTLGISLAVSAVTALVVVATIVLLWLRPSNEFFAAHTAARRGGR